MPQVELADGGPFLTAVRDAVDDERTGAADAFAAIGVEGDRFLAARDELLVHHVEHFQERHVGDEVFGLVAFDASG